MRRLLLAQQTFSRLPLAFLCSPLNAARYSSEFQYPSSHPRASELAAEHCFSAECLDQLGAECREQSGGAKLFRVAGNTRTEASPTVGKPYGLSRCTLDEVHEVLRSLAEAPVVPPSMSFPPVFDPRHDAITAFDEYLKAADRCRGKLGLLSIDSVRVPIAVNSGFTGSGKTCQLSLVCAHFVKKEEYAGAKSLYVTFNGLHDDFDDKSRLSIRMAHRLLHAAAASTMPLADFCRTFREKLSMAPCNGNARNDSENEREDWLSDPSFLIAVCRRLLEMKPSEPLLIAADELRRLGSCKEVGEKCRLTVAGLSFLAALSQRSFIDWPLPLPNEPDVATKPTYVVASAYAAIDHTNVWTEMTSDRRVFHLPLPPLDLTCGWDKKIRSLAGGNDEARAAGRHCLYLLHHKPREFDECYTLLLQTSPVEWKALHDKYKETYTEQYEAAAQAFVDCCAAKGIEPWELVQHVFWPTTAGDNMTYDAEARAALIAEQVGLCTILRDGGKDAIYAHPLALQALLKRRSDTFDPATSALVQKLCEMLLELPAAVGSEQVGKFFEEIMTLAVVCRIATHHEDTMCLEDLFPRNSSDDFFATMIVRTALAEASIVAFPRALANDGTWRNVECSEIPAGPFYSIPSDRHNVVVDSLVSVMPPPSDATMGALIGLQMKKYAKAPTVDLALQRSSRAQHFDSANVRTALEKRAFVHVLVTPNAVDTEPQSWALRDGAKCYEAQLTHQDMKQCCPMVAYSVLQPDELIRDDFRSKPSL